MIEVKKDEFYKSISFGDITSKPVGKYPFKTIFKLRYGEEVGVIKSYIDKSKPGFTKNKYYLTEKFYNKVSSWI